ncbi:hypothetical protein [Catenuloplanes indicus]|uniref:Uncharacterized protein n=1 Tax=Catenuloplanes indicus TaxID=137267 RepID=A0AAE3VYR1_9ACTN|nr:hypothetical protein [Catenuloplanes indicus]MDQ0366170.1 hypothetical protein [Catenuloplanes indicus]
MDHATVAALLERLRHEHDGRAAVDQIGRRLWWTVPQPVLHDLVTGLRRHLTPDDPRRTAVADLLAAGVRHIGEAWPPSTRAAARAALATAVPDLLVLLDDPGPRVRQHVMQTLVAVAPTDPGVAAALLARTRSESDPAALADLLHALDDLAAALPGWFRSWLSHPEPPVRLAAVAALARRSGRAGVNADGAAGPTGERVPPADAVPPAEGGARGPDEADDVAAGLLAVPGLSRLPDSPRFASPRSGRLDWLAGRLGVRPERAARFAAAARRAGTPETAALAVGAAVAVVWRYRVPRPGGPVVLPPESWTALWATAADGLEHADHAVRRAAAELLAVAGEAARPHAGALVRALERDTDGAVLALTRLDDPRVLPVLRERSLAGTNVGSFMPPVTVLGPMRVHAAVLLPSVRATIRAAGSGAAMVLPVLAEWGPDAAGALPDLLPLLATEHAYRACVVLGRIGVAAAPAAETLRALATGGLRPTRVGGVGTALPWPGTQVAAWAHWRVTGDPALALAVLGRAVTRGPGRADLARLADLGPLAAAHRDDVRALLTGPGEWGRVEAAHAWWRLTGDPAPAVPVLLDALRAVADGRPSATGHRAVRHLGRIATPAALPALDAILARPERIISRYADDPVFGYRTGLGMQPVLADEELVADAVLARGAILSRV